MCEKTLVIAQGDIAKIFLDSILDKYFSNDYYVVISKDMVFYPIRFQAHLNFILLTILLALGFHKFIMKRFIIFFLCLMMRLRF